MPEEVTLELWEELDCTESASLCCHNAADAVEKAAYIIAATLGCSTNLAIAMIVQTVQQRQS